MIIKLSPTRSDDELAITRNGDALVVNGKEIDFGHLNEGESVLPEEIGCPLIIQPATRANGEIVVTVIMPYGLLAGEASKFPSDIIDPPDGRVRLPTDSDPREPEFL